MNSVERWILGALAALGLLMFFFPVLTVTIPIAGAKSRTGYDVVLALSDRDHITRTLSGQQSVTPPSSQSADNPYSEPPLSLRLAPVMSMCVGVGFLTAAVTLVGTFLSRRIVTVATLVGTAASVAAIIHLRIMNSDLHRMLDAQIAQSKTALKDNPFAGLADGLSQLMLSSFSMLPGTGLYVLGACLGASLLIARTGILSRLTLLPAPEKDSASVVADP